MRKSARVLERYLQIGQDLRICCKYAMPLEDFVLNLSISVGFVIMILYRTRGHRNLDSAFKDRFPLRGETIIHVIPEIVHFLTQYS